MPLEGFAAVNVAATSPQGTLEAASPATRSRLSRLAAAGGALRLASGLYAVGATLSPELVARHHLHDIIGHFWPQAILCGRTAFAGGGPADGVVFVAHPDPPRRSVLILPGIKVVPGVGPGPLPGDMPLPAGLFMSGPARALVENIDLQGRPARYRAGTAAVEDRIDTLARSGADRVRTTLGQLDVIASSFHPAAVAQVRRYLTAVLGTISDAAAPRSPRLAARLSGDPYDAHRIDMVEGIVTVLETNPPRPQPALPPVTRWEWLAFFEAYFSNFIEGTEFGVDEARLIAVDGVIPETRPEDAHDVAATYRLTVDPSDRVRVPRSGDELIDIVVTRHATLMAARPDQHPGQLKKIPNYAGGYQFVEPALVAGTLKRGFDTLNRLHDPLARAAAMMVLVTESHPFDDGNGRVARLTANAELSRAGQVRVVIPTVYRNDYLAALNALSNGAGQGESLVAVLAFAQRWAAAVDWSTYAHANEIITACNAYLDPALADRTSRRLTFPT